MTFLQLFRRPTPRAAAWGLAILASGLLATAYFTRQARTVAQAEARQGFDASGQEIEARIKVRMAAHEQILRSGAAFFADDNGVTRSEFRDYAARQNIDQTLPGIQGLGFAKVVPRSGLEQHLRGIRAEGLPSYRIWPEGERETYTSIVFLEPFADRNLRAFGYDMFSEPVRRSAMERARDRDEVALSGKVLLVQEDEIAPQAGTLMYAPVYRNHAPHATVAERRADLLGWVYSPYRMGDLISTGILGGHDRAAQQKTRLEIFDGESATPTALLYDSQPQEDASPLAGAGPRRETVVEHAGRPWLLRFTSINPVGGLVDYRRAWLVFSAGVVMSLLLAGLVLSLANTGAAARLLASRMSADLRESELRWKFAIEGAGDGLWDWNVPASTVFFSNRWKTMLGFAEDEIGDGLDEWSKRVHPDDLAAVMAAVQAHLTGATPSYVNEHRVRCKDGSWKWILARGLVVERDAAGQPLRVIGTHSDITERKRASELLEMQLFGIETQSDAMFWITGGGVILNLNAAACTLVGYTKEELRGAPVGDVDARWDAETWAKHFAELRQSGCVRFEFDQRHRDGHTRPVEIVANYVKFGELELNVSMVRDITERKQAERTMRESAELIRQLLQTTDQGIYGINSDGDCTFINRAGLEALGYQPEDCLGKDMHDLIHHKFPDGSPYPGADCPISRSRTTGAACRVDSEFLWRRDGTSFPAEYSSYPVLVDGEVQGAVVTFTDITERKQAEARTRQAFVDEGEARQMLLSVIEDQKQAEEALRTSLEEKEALLKEVHHRVKNNLQVITSLLRLEASRTADAAARRVLRDMQGRILSMALLHETLYRTGMFGRVDLAHYLRQLAGQLFRAHNPKSDRPVLALDLSPVQADLDQAIPCGLIVNELLANSLKHGFAEERSGEVKLSLQQDAEGVVRMGVSDTGVGLPADFEERRGKSLGLQLVSDLSRQLGGRLEVGAGPGARFIVIFTATTPHLTGQMFRPKKDI